MPPGRKPGRGRGGAAGRGRGKAAPPAEGEQPFAQVVPQANMQEAADTEETLPDPEPMDVDPSPNSSPVTIPTETPAPTPARPSGSRPILPPSRASSSVRSNTAPNTTSGQTPSAAPPKFKPKAIRRKQDEREALGRLEEERQKQAKRDAQREIDFANRGRGRGRGARGRGDAMGRRETPRTTATGVFGITPEEMARQGIPSFSSGGGGPGGISSGGGGGGGSGGGGGGGGRNNAGYRGVGVGEGSGRVGADGEWEPAYPLEEGEVYTRPVNVENINNAYDEDDDVVVTGVRKVKKTTGSGGAGGLRPVRLPRFEHRERVAIVNTDTPAVKKEESTADVDLTAPEASAEGSDYQAPDSPELPKIKQEPSSPSSPRLRRTLPAASSGTNGPSSSPTRSPTQTKTRIKPPTSPTAVRKAPPPEPKKPAEPIFATEEDRAEYHRHLEDVAILARELGGLQSGEAEKGKGPALDAEGDENMEEGLRKKDSSSREGRLYLFQFPPVLPKLYNPTTTKKPPGPNDIKIKKESEIKAPSSPTLSKSKPKQSANDAVKTEPDAEEVLVPLSPEDPNARRRRDRVVDDSGYIGKMIVRESGKVEFDWGGASMVINRGIDASFLSTGLIVDKDERGGTNKDGEGTALSMGKIMGKFVVKPDFAKMLGDDF